jgi:hypothetical protein
MIKLVRRGECWKLTGCATLLLTVSLGMVFWFVVVKVYPFLAITERVLARVLVIEGWMQPSAMKQAAAEFRSGQYNQVLLIQPVFDLKDQYEPGRYCRKWVEALFVQQGVPKEQMATLFPSVAMKDRTYHSALAVKEWLAGHGLTKISINVVTQGPHARRSSLLYQKVFSDCCEVGIIALRSLDYDPAHWWRTSAGVREVIGESIAYLYAKFFF